MLPILRRLMVVAFVVALSACARQSMLVYSSGFSFSRYEYVVVDKNDGRGTSTSLYGTDVELANLLTRYNMKVIGGQEYQQLSADDKAKTIFARMSMEATGKMVTLSVSFDDMVSGRTGASITSYTKGKIFKPDDRQKAFDKVTKEIVSAFQHDKGLRISEPDAKN